MQAVRQGTPPGKSGVFFLPMIDMSSNDMNCIYSTLRCVCKEAKRRNVKTPVLTFDQPLWWKAQIIVASQSGDNEIRGIVLRLGGFHAEMSFLGCIGHIMTGSGLHELLEVVYCPNTVGHEVARF